MNKSILKRIIASLIASAAVLSFAACGTGGDGGAVGGEVNTPSTDGGSVNTPPAGGGSESNGGNDVVPPVVIPTVPTGSVKITEACGDLEEAYVLWEKVDGAMGYNVYVRNEGENGGYEKLDAPLVREYKDYYRADALGLKAGTYGFKVVPTGGAELAEDDGKAGTATQITVLAHERSGYAFVDGSSSGAYNDDGTLKANANVIYVTDANKDTVPLNMASGTVYGIQNILDAQKKEGKPLAIRLIGGISAPDITQSKANNNNKNPNTLLIKGDGKGGDLAVTLEGIGNDATANGWTLRITSSTDVEIRNIGFMNTLASEPDGVTLEKDNHVWVHNCDIFYGGAGGDSDQAKGDGALDTKESSYITHSYNHFWDSGKSNLQNMHESGDWRITYHHNWYDHSDSRHPRIRSATVHVYNNYFDGNAKYGVGACEGANVFVENNYYRSTSTMKPMLSSKQGTDLANAEGGNPDNGTFSKEDGGMIKAYGNVFDGKYSLITQDDTSDKTNLDCYMASDRNEVVPGEYVTKYGGTAYSNFDTAADFYDYEADSPEVAKEKVEKYAGRVGGGDFKWDFDDETEDANSSIIVALKAALTNYKSGLVSVDGIEIGSSGGDTSEGGGETEGGGTAGGEVSGDIGKIEFTSSTSYPAGISISGNYSSNSGYLKMESATKITITMKDTATVTIHTNSPSKKIKINGTSTTLDGNGECTVTVNAGDTLTIEKGDTMELEYIIIG